MICIYIYIIYTYIQIISYIHLSCRNTYAWLLKRWCLPRRPARWHHGPAGSRYRGPAALEPRTDGPMGRCLSIMNIHTYVYMYTQTYIYINRYVYAEYIYICIYTVHLYIYIYVYMYYVL